MSFLFLTAGTLIVFRSSFWKKLKDNDIKVLAINWPTFMYQDYTCDPNDHEKGLCRGHLVVSVSRFMSFFIVLADLPPLCRRGVR